MNKKNSINIDKEIRNIIIGIDIAVNEFNKQLDKADLKKLHKDVIKNCFALGLASSVLLEMRKIVSKLDKKGV